MGPLACSSGAVTTDQVLGGVEVPHAALESGRRIYLRNCAPCHGLDGNGKGPAAIASWPAPRDFTTATFKFAGIEGRDLPADAELFRIIGHGLPGSSMPAWDLPDGELRDVVDYIKTFSLPRRGFRDPARKPRAPEIPAVPPAAEQAGLAAKGERIYHEVFQCAKCHPGYPEGLFAGSPKLRSGDEPVNGYSGLRGRNEDAPAPKYSADYDSVLLPTDFTRHAMRSVRFDSAGADPRDLFRAIAYGLAGPMPGYRHLGEENVWAVVFYVKALADISRQQD